MENLDHDPRDYFAPLERLRELEAQGAVEAMGGGGPTERPECLPVSAIVLVAELLQHRGTDEKHIGDLRRALRNNGKLDPMVVLAVADRFYLVDGHHRHAAYEAERVTYPVPVSYYTGTVADAVLEAAIANSKAKLPMTTRERMELAWKLVLMGRYSRKQIRAAASVSDGQVLIMRRVAKALGAQAYAARSWREAQLKASEREPMKEEEMEEWLDRVASEYAERMGKTFGNKLSTNPGLAARALSQYFGRKLPDLLYELKGYLPETEDEDQRPF
jgi:hypothetical protein